MKAFIFLLLAAALGIGGYLYWPQIQQFAEESRSSQTAPPVVDTGIVPIPKDEAPVPEMVPKREEPTQSELEAELEKAMAREEPKEEKPVAPKLPDYSEELEAKYPMPKIKSLEEAVGNWTDIPKGALPQTITSTTDITIKLPSGAGQTVAKAGTPVIAIAANDTGLLAVAPNEGSKARGRVKMDDTNFKEVVTAVYDNFVTRSEEEVLAKRSAERRKLQAADRMRDEFGVTSGFEIIGEKPETDANGRVAAMVASIKAKDVTEFDLAKIDAWTPVFFDEVEGEPYWTSTVKYKAKTIFGNFDAEAMALMRKGKVEKWIYAGSGEPVP